MRMVHDPNGPELSLWQRICLWASGLERTYHEMYRTSAETSLRYNELATAQKSHDAAISSLMRQLDSARDAGARAEEKERDTRRALAQTRTDLERAIRESEGYQAQLREAREIALSSQQTARSAYDRCTQAGQTLAHATDSLMSTLGIMPKTSTHRTFILGYHEGRYTLLEASHYLAPKFGISTDESDPEAWLRIFKHPFERETVTIGMHAATNELLARYNPKKDQRAIWKKLEYETDLAHKNMETTRRHMNIHLLLLPDETQAHIIARVSLYKTHDTILSSAQLGEMNYFTMMPTEESLRTMEDVLAYISLQDRTGIARYPSPADSRHFDPEKPILIDMKYLAHHVVEPQSTLHKTLEALHLWQQIARKNKEQASPGLYVLNVPHHLTRSPYNITAHIPTWHTAQAPAESLTAQATHSQDQTLIHQEIPTAHTPPSPDIPGIHGGHPETA